MGGIYEWIEFDAWKRYPLSQPHPTHVCTMPVIYELQKHTDHSGYLIDRSQITFYKHKACSVYVAHETSSLWAFFYPCSSSSSLSPDNIFNTLSLFDAVGAVWPQ